MRILVDLNHPAHVHLFRNAIAEWRARGAEVLITARDKDITARLLDLYGLDHRRTARAQGRGVLRFAAGVARLDWAVWRAAGEFRPDWLVGTSFAIAHAARFLPGRSIVFAEDDFASSSAFWRITRPFADFIVTPDTIPDDFGRGHITYRGCQKLAYLHPNRFTPDPAALAEYGLRADEPYFVLRFVSFQASHDVGQRGMDADTQRELVRRLERRGRVLITAEGRLPEEFAAYQLQTAPHKIHHLLAFARLFVGDSQSMTLEAALLGTPALRCNTFVGRTPVIDRLEADYGLTQGFRIDQTGALLACAEKLIDDPATPARWQERRARYLADHIDVTAWMVELPEELAAA
ncbi:MAG: DUF354 domain-containing protein [Chloroflexi bacterium]|nr:DUF354 domain-containing protein [Chloroflexota bacterium]